MVIYCHCCLIPIIENLTKEEYSGEYRNDLLNLGASQNTLNPQHSLDTLKNRLWVSEFYRLQHGVEHAHWPHFFLRNVGRHLNKYKFNYAVKGYLVYLLYREFANFQYQNSIKFMPANEQSLLLAKMGLNGGAAALAFLYF
ncbi:UNKNOWN [Stylonychia lemnae]|uniref:Uncharacterized protein n=1 Tax=Stylonychia lemnae TaxID=5949 RepID=A0A077ZP44_STYLE|nr:UNKNOWN [Stylonychia lemnae]|eukprot:CDW71683.1 UNKNOWN [Stylonychia lemnae]